MLIREWTVKSILEQWNDEQSFGNGRPPHRQGTRHASGMPEGEKVVPWLEARSLIQKVENGWAIVKAGPYDGSPISHHM